MGMREPATPVPVSTSRQCYKSQRQTVNMFDWTWPWHYPAKKASGLFVFSGCMATAFSLEPVLVHGQEPSYMTAGGLMMLGTGCAMLVYHIKKGGKEDTAAKKKIALVGLAAVMPMVALETLSLLNTIL